MKNEHKHLLAFHKCPITKSHSMFGMKCNQPHLQLRRNRKKLHTLPKATHPLNVETIFKPKRRILSLYPHIISFQLRAATCKSLQNLMALTNKNHFINFHDFSEAGICSKCLRPRRLKLPLGRLRMLQRPGAGSSRELSYGWPRKHKCGLSMWLLELPHSLLDGFQSQVSQENELEVIPPFLILC